MITMTPGGPLLCVSPLLQCEPCIKSLLRISCQRSWDVWPLISEWNVTLLGLLPPEGQPTVFISWGLCPYDMSSHSQHWFLWLSYHLWYSHTKLVRPEPVLINLTQWYNSRSLVCIGPPGKMGSSAIRNTGYASFVSFSETGWWICWQSRSLPAPDLAVYGKGAIAMKSLFTNTACASIAILGLTLLIDWISEEVPTNESWLQKTRSAQWQNGRSKSVLYGDLYGFLSLGQGNQ